jgi:hypothetical protein
MIATSAASDYAVFHFLRSDGVAVLRNGDLVVLT